MQITTWIPFNITRKLKLDEMTDKSVRATRQSLSLQSENSERSTQKAEPKPKTFLFGVVKKSRHDEKITGDVYPVRFLRRRFDSSWVYVQAVAPSTLRERLKKPKLLLCVVPRPQTMEEPTLGFTKGRVWVLVVISTALDQDSSSDHDGHTGLGARTWCGPSFKKSSVLHCWCDSMNNLTYISFAANYTSHQQNSPKPRPGGMRSSLKASHR